jgi:GAF domain-containing protein
MLAGTFSVLALVVVARIATDRSSPVDWLIAGLVGVVVLAAVRHQAAVRALEAGRREEAETFARILSGLSRSVSPDAIVAAIVRELGTSTGADHIVVVCRRAEARILDATLVSTRPGVPDSSTTLPIADLEEPADGRSGGTRSPVGIPIVAEVDPTPEPAMASRSRILDGLVDRAIRARSGLAGRLRPTSAHAHAHGRPRGNLPESGQFVADRIARRVRAVYGLRDTIAAPLTTDAGVVGAIVLSRRVQEDWPPSSRRILAGAARRHRPLSRVRTRTGPPRHAPRPTP